MFCSVLKDFGKHSVFRLLCNRVLGLKAIPLQKNSVVPYPFVMNLIEIIDQNGIRNFLPFMALIKI
jgi:hypothetical protein